MVCVGGARLKAGRVLDPLIIESLHVSVSVRPELSEIDESVHPRTLFLGVVPPSMIGMTVACAC
eukprot:9383799-Alexandrium_andersonii.AAC.1